MSTSLSVEQLEEMLTHFKEQQRIANQQILLIKREIKRKKKADRNE